MAYCILYPGTKICIISASKNQSQLIISSKIKVELADRFPAIAREILEIKTGVNDSSVKFKNGSFITVVVGNDNARGYRSNINIYDESRMLSNDLISKVFKPFLNVLRQPNFLKRPDIKDKEKYQEENKELFLTSCWYSGSELHNQFLDFKDKMLKGKSVFTCSLPFTVSVEHGLLTKKRVEAMRTDSSMTEATWQMEMEGRFYGSGEGGMFDIDMINACRTNKNMFYPPTNEEWLADKHRKRPWRMKRVPGEKRLIGMDIALISDQKESSTKGKNDNSVIFCMRLIPSGKEYERLVCHIETMNGSHSEKQAIRLKQLYYDFEADYIALDCHGNGVSVYDYLNKVQYDEERDVEYNAFSTYNNDNLASRASKNALPCIFGIKASAEFNHNIAMGLKDKLISKKLSLPEDDYFAKERMMEDESFAKMSPEKQARKLLPFLQTTALANELIGLQMSIQGGFVKLKEKSTARKDRYSALAYINQLATNLEKDLVEDVVEEDYDKFSTLW